MTATRWCAANGTTGHYWTLDLGAVHALARFEVIWEYPTSAAGLPYGYVVSVSNDGTTFTTAIDRSTTTSTMQIQTNDFPPATSGRHVRITAVLLPTGAWASFFEARVFGQ
jgi:alpha-L-fucosidase